MGQSMPEIARALEVPIGTIRKWRTRDKWNKALAVTSEVVPAPASAIEPELRGDRFAEALAKIEPLLDVEDVLGRHKRVNRALHNVVTILAGECQRRATKYRSQPEHADWDSLAKLTDATIKMGAAILNQEVFIHQAVADRANAIVQRMSPEELEAVASRDQNG